MSSFNTVIHVRFGHVDPAGIVYFPRIYDYIHEVFETMWEEHVGEDYHHLLLERRIGFPLVHSHVDFTAPLKFGSHPEVQATCFKLGHASLGMRYRILLDDVLCVDARMITACVNTKTMKNMRFPDEFRASFEAIMESE